MISLVMRREPIWCWMEREKNISRDDWNSMVDRAADQFLRETTPQGEIAQTFAQLETTDSIAASEVGGGVERILGKALGWSSYESRPDDLPELSFAIRAGDE